MKRSAYHENVLKERNVRRNLSERNTKTVVRLLFTCKKRIAVHCANNIDFLKDYLSHTSSKTEIPMAIRNSKVRKQDKFRRLVSTLEHLQVQRWTGLGVRRSKRPLLACRNRCKCSMETSRWLVYLIIKFRYNYLIVINTTWLFYCHIKQMTCHCTVCHYLSRHSVAWHFMTCQPTDHRPMVCHYWFVTFGGSLDEWPVHWLATLW